MKLRIIPWLALLTVIVSIYRFGGDFWLLNQLGVNTAHLKMTSQARAGFAPSAVDNDALACHQEWLQFVRQPAALPPDVEQASRLIACSSTSMRMLWSIYPSEPALANLAVQLYPGQAAPLYWLISVTDPQITDQSKPLIEEILRINPRDGLAWRYLGIILIQEDDIQGAIEAHIHSCYNGDPGSNGCYNAGRLLEQEGRYEEALYYYRLSRWPVSQQAADDLEARLNGN